MSPRGAVFRNGMKAAAKTILAAERILIVCHRRPDGDAIGSLLALGLGLLSLDKQVVMVSPDGVPPRYQFLPGSELILKKLAGKVDAAVAVDCGSAEQLGAAARLFKAAPVSVQIDHHDFADRFGMHLVADAAAAAVGEIVYELLLTMKAQITPVIATCLLTAIIVDTGSFRFSNVRSRTFRICADLLDCGADLKYLVDEAYWKKTESTMRLEALCVNQMRFERNGKVVWSYIRQRDFARLNGQVADVDGVADDLRSLEGVKIAALFREDPCGRCRVSLRSATGINVAEVARHFGGGGHFNSAAFWISNTKSERSRVIRVISSVVP
ncbi:MAG: bifunctional oligoribonuclease/PAP phosphatase NrnA [Candidatus Omnitrophica bacterium]|nr:bifunctional oligoribonuclease/PAP phosphatase NrnA [Candidatus Omnitrophota bacterium]